MFIGVPSLVLAEVVMVDGRFLQVQLGNPRRLLVSVQLDCMIRPSGALEIVYSWSSASIMQVISLHNDQHVVSTCANFECQCYVRIRVYVCTCACLCLCACMCTGFLLGEAGYSNIHQIKYI